MSSNLLRVVQEQQETIEKQSRLIADLIATLESWEQTAGYDGAELKERAENLQLTGAGTNYAKTGETTGKGVFTIVEVKAGQGASAGWGRLKSGAGWISLDYATRLA